MPAASPRSAARPARGRSSPASRSAPAAGGGRRRARRNAGSISGRAGPTRSPPDLSLEFSMDLSLPASLAANVEREVEALAATAQAGLTHLDRLEAESIHIMREVVAECANPVLLYSIGKDSSVLLH